MALFRRAQSTDPDAVRMSLGDHLEELRGCLLRSIVALLTACLLCIWPAKFLLEILARPVVLALRRHGQPDSFLATGPVESLMVYVKVVLIARIVLASPYILHQLWAFVAAGLYPHEKKWVHRLVPASVGLFLLGVVFMYLFALLLSLNFLVGFSGWLPQPQADPTALERLLLQMPEPQLPATQPAADAPPAVPIVRHDPNTPSPGAVWFNVDERKLKLRGVDGTYSLQLVRDQQRALVTTHFRIGEYLSFVLMLTIAFGTAFQMPLVVLFLARTGLVPLETLRRYRKIVIVVIVFIAGLLAPPDLLSHLMLIVPMLVLFEAWLWLAGRGDKVIR